MSFDTLYPKMPEHLRYPVYPIAWSFKEHFRYWYPLKGGYGRIAVEQQLANMYGATCVFLTDSGRSALVLALKALGVGLGQEVILTTYNCPAVIDSVLSVGAEPVLVDIDYNFGMNFESVKREVTDRTTVILLTHCYGMNENIELIRWARMMRLYVIDDAAQAMFKTQEGKCAGSFGDVGILSFNSTKSLFALGGGALLWYGEPAHINRLENGIPTEPTSEVKKRYKEFWYERRMNFLLSSSLCKTIINGSKRGWIPIWKADKLDTLPNQVERIKPQRMHDVKAELLKIQLKKFQLLKSWTHRNFKFLHSQFSKDVPCIQVVGDADGEQGYNYATLLVENAETRYFLSVYLSKNGVQTTWNYYPLHLISLYKQYGRGVPVAEELWKRVLSIPFKPKYNIESLRNIVNAVKNFYSEGGLS